VSIALADFGDTDAHGRLERAPFEVDRRGLDLSPDPFGKASGIVDRRRAHEERELLATVPGEKILRADTTRDLVHDSPKHDVARSVTGSVVDRLEVIEIEEHHAERDAVTPCMRELDLEPLAKEATVVRTRERVTCRRFVELPCERVFGRVEH